MMTMGMMMRVPEAMMTREREFCLDICPIKFWALQDVVCLLVMHADYTSSDLHSDRFDLEHKDGQSSFFSPWKSACCLSLIDLRCQRKLETLTTSRHLLKRVIMQGLFNSYPDADLLIGEH
jgi:hypothetical protein